MMNDESNAEEIIGEEYEIVGETDDTDEDETDESDE